MAQATAEVKDRFGGDQFPIHYERNYLRVYTNSSGELFVEHTYSGVTVRINPFYTDGLQFTTDGRVGPIRVANTIGWLIESH